MHALRSLIFMEGTTLLLKKESLSEDLWKYNPQNYLNCAMIHSINVPFKCQTLNINN